MTAASLKEAKFLDVIKDTWETSDKDPRKFRITIEPLLQRFTKDGLKSWEEQEKKEGILKGTENKLRLIKNLSGEYTVIHN